VSPACPRCGRPLDHAAIVSGVQTCRLCRGRFEAIRFDPPPPDVAVARVPEAGPEATHPCPAHPGNAATVHCSRCGVFACALCRIETDGMVLCPACFERLADAGELPSLVSSYRDHGRAQALLVLLGFVFFFLAPVTGPASIYYGTRALEQRRAMQVELQRGAVYALYGVGVAQAIAGIAFFVWIAS
jgi:hypothetical protein